MCCYCAMQWGLSCFIEFLILYLRYLNSLIKLANVSKLLRKGCIVNVILERHYTCIKNIIYGLEYHKFLYHYIFCLFGYYMLYHWMQLTFPFRMKLPFIVGLWTEFTEAFSCMLSKLTCCLIFSSNSSLSDLLRKVDIFLNTPIMSSCASSKVIIRTFGWCLRFQ